MPCKQVCLSIGVTLGYLEGICFLGLFVRRGKYFWFLSCTQRTLRLWVWGWSGTLLKGQGSCELISDYRAQRARL
jgi:hypothetical protein